MFVCTPNTLTPLHLHRVALEAGEEEWRWVQWRYLAEVNNGYRDRISTLRNRYQTGSWCEGDLAGVRET